MGRAMGLVVNISKKKEREGKGKEARDNPLLTSFLP